MDLGVERDFMSHSSLEILDLALKSGASHAEIYLSSALSRPVFF